MAEELSIVGKKLSRIDGFEKVTGRAQYSGDIRIPNMLYGKILRSPYPNVKIKRIDTRKAEAHPGVKAVISFKNVPKIEFHSPDGFIFSDSLRYVGEEVAAVAAVNRDVASEALGLIAVEYQQLPFFVDPEDALKPETPHVRPGKSHFVSGGFPPKELDKPKVIEWGDVEKGFSEADFIIEDTFRTQSQCHVCMETHRSICLWEGNHLTVWLSTQGVGDARMELAKALNLPMSKIRVIMENIGGGYGSKGGLGSSRQAIICALLAKKAGRPVGITLDREEEFFSTTYRPQSIQQWKVGVKKDGTLTAIYMKSINNEGLYDNGFSNPSLRPSQLYNCPNLRMEDYGVYTNTPKHGPCRATNAPVGHFGLEQMMDQIAEKLGMDPIELRMKNYNPFGDQVKKIPYSSNGLDQCYRLGVEKIGWQRRKKSGEAVDGRKRRGMGMASLIFGGDGGRPASAIVKISNDGSVEVLCGFCDIGTGANTIHAQIAAEELELSLEKVSIVSGDTESTPYVWQSVASHTTADAGVAVRLAAADVKKKLLKQAAVMLKVKEEDLELKDGKIYIKGTPEKSVSFGEVVEKTFDKVIIGTGSREPNPENLVIRTFGAHFAEVEVDMETGDVTILKFIAAHDLGRAINPMLAENQIMGGAIYGMGYALTEEKVFDKSTGIPVNFNLHDYKILTSLDVPEIEPLIAPTIDPAIDNFGAKGIGEPGVVGVAATLANAIYNAAGIRIKELPITKDKILEALSVRDSVIR